MEELDRLWGIAQGLTEASDDVISLKNALKATLSAMNAVCDEIKQLRKDYDEMNEYVTRIDEDLSELELMHDEEAEYDKLYDGEEDEEDDETEDDRDDDRLDDMLSKLFAKDEEQDENDENRDKASGLFMWKNDDNDE